MARMNRVGYQIYVDDNASRKLRKIEGRVKGLSKEVLRLSGFLGAGFGVKEIAELADTWRLMENRIRLVTSSTEELKAVQRELVEVSAATRSSYESTANLYARVARSSRELGLSQRELLDFTTTVQQSIRISGSTAAEASAGVIQFGQALASSRLSGDELRSVLEQMPRLAQAIAEGMGVGIGALRELGEEGELTATAVLDALRQSAPQIAEEFKKLKPLVSEAFVVLKSSFMSAIGTIDEAAGASQDFAQWLLESAEQVRLLGDAITGQLDLKKLERATDLTKGLAISLMTAVSAVMSLKDGLDLSLGAGADFLRNVLSRMMEVYPALKGAAEKESPGITKAFEAAWKDTLDDVRLNHFNQQTEIINDWKRWVNTMDNIMGEPITFPDVDLETPPEKRDFISRAQREAIRKAQESLEKMNTEMRQQVQAYADAQGGAVDYKTALHAIKVAALAAASGNEKLAGDVIFLAGELQKLEAESGLKEQLQTLKDQAAAYQAAAISGRDFSTELKLIEIQALASKFGLEGLVEEVSAYIEFVNKLSARSELLETLRGVNQEIEALKIARDTGAEIADALEEVRLRALAAKFGLKGLSEEIIEAKEQAKRLNNEIADQKAIESLRNELSLIRLTNRERFVQEQLQKLSVHATTDQIAAARALADELFTIQERIRTEIQVMEAIVDQAARNMQDAFADFLFDPFEEGAKGMVRVFIEAIRRMLAELVAAQFANRIAKIFNLIGVGVGTGGGGSVLPTGRGGGSPIPFSGVPGMSTGGPITAGMPVLVGERGPELLIGAGGGRILNNSATKATLGQAAAPQFITNIDARGADPGLIARLPAFMEDRDRRLLSVVQRYFETGVLPV